MLARLRWVAVFTVTMFATGWGAERLTLTRALELAAQSHPQLQAAESRKMAAAAQLLTAGAYPNPQVGFLTGRQYSQPLGGRIYNVPMVTFAQPLELGPLRSSRMDLAKRGLESAEHSVEGLRLAILSTVRFTYYDVLRADAEIVIADEALHLAEDLRNRIRVRVEVGEAGRLELVRANAEVSSARSIAANARIRRSSALASFRAAVGGQLPPGAEPAGTVPATANLPPLETLRAEVLAKHPALSLADSEVRRANARLDYERALQRPQPQLMLEADNTNPSIRMGFSIELPAWNRRRGEIASAQAQLRESRFLVNSRRTELLEALERAYGRFQTSNEEVATLEQGLMKEAEEAVRGAEVAYQLGERSIIEVLDAQRVLRTIRLNLVNALFGRQAAIVEINELRATNLGEKE